MRAVISVIGGGSSLLQRVRPTLSGRFGAASLLVASRRARQGAVLKKATVRSGRSSQLLPVVVLVAHDIHDRGGMERACAELIRRGRGKIDFIVVAADLAPELRPFVKRWVQARIPRRPFPLKFVLFWFFAGRALRHIEADLVHTVGAILPNRVDVASIHFCHAGFLAANGGLAPRDAPLMRRANTALSRALALAAERWSYRPSRLRAFATVSLGVAEEVARFYSSIPMTVTPNGVDIERFRPDLAVRAALRAAETVGEAVVALFVGGDWDRKGLHIAIDAVSKVRAAGYDLRLWVVGHGDAARLGALAKRHGVAREIRFFGPRSDIERFYQAADLLVMPSAYEAFSLVCLEAAASGLPLVIPPISGASEIVGSDEGGLVVERSVRFVADALATLASDAELRIRLGVTARQHASAYTWQRSAESVMNLYEALLAEGGAR